MFLQRKKTRILLTAFGAHIPETPSELQEQNVYPVALRTENGFDLDYSTLLLVDELILDRTAYEYIKSDRRPHLLPMRESVERLLDSELMVVEDFDVIGNRMKEEIRNRVDKLVEYPEYWLDTARVHWGIYKAELPEVIRRLGNNANPDIEKIHFGIYCHLMKTKGRIDFQEAERITRLLESRKKKLTAGEQEVIRNIIRPLISYVLFNHLLMREKNTPFIDWQDLQPWYEKITSPVWSDREKDQDISQEMVARCRKLFNLVIPELKPSSVKEVIKFLKKKRAVASLRKELRDSIEQGHALDAQWINKVRDAANLAQITSRKRSRIISLFGNLLGLGPVGTLAEIGVSVMEESASQLIGDIPPKRFDWYYTLLSVKQDEKSAS